MKYLLIFSICLFSFVFAQSPKTSDRMEQDLHVMSEILYELFQSDLQMAGIRLRNSNQEAKYQEGFGVVLYAPALRQSTSNRYLLATSPSSGKGGTAKAPSSFTATLVSPDTIKKEVIRNLRFFLQQYGDLASALDKNEKVMVVYDPKHNGSAMTFYHGRVSGGSLSSTGSDAYQGSISASVKVADIRALRRGELSENAFQSRVEVHAAQEEGNTQLEYRVFGKILSKRLYEIKSGMDKPNEIQLEDDRTLFFSFPTPKVEMKLLDGLGATYEIVWGSGFSGPLYIKENGTGKRLSRVAIIGNEDDKTTEKGKNQVNKNVEEWTQKMREEVPEILVSYGRTLRKLKADEQLTVRIELPQCYNCKAPQYITYSIYGKTLASYDRNEISLAEAMRRVRVEEEPRGEER